MSDIENSNDEILSDYSSEFSTSSNEEESKENENTRNIRINNLSGYRLLGSFS